VIDEVTKSGFRGRAGGDFPTGREWQISADTNAQVKYVICNSDEGDPDAFVDRKVLEGDPHRVIESIIIGVYAVGASKG
jgi:NADH:ubiquinone oxidoreductase subunit F (NADH-binding)